MQGFDLSSIYAAYVGGTLASAIYYNNASYETPSLIWPLTSPSEYADQYFTIESLSDNNEITIYWDTREMSTYNDRHVWCTYYSDHDDDPSYWTDISTSYDYNFPFKITLNKGQILRFKGNEKIWDRESHTLYDQWTTGIPEFKLNSSNIVKIYGNLATFVEGKPIVKLCKQGVSFREFFRGLRVVDAANLYIDMLLSESTFYGAFAGSSSLIYAPSILYPTKMKRSCYESMFQGCTSLIYPPALPSTILADECYENMFYGCTSLRFGPELPAIKLAYYCYSNMFAGCTSLTTAPALPATMLAESCYYRMFYGCTSLTTSPILTSTKNEGYGFCYNEMFSGCTSLNNITCLYDPNLNPSHEDYSTMMANWVTNVASTGTFYKREGTNWPTGNSGIPYGWTILNSNISHPLTIMGGTNNGSDVYITNTTNEFVYSLDEGQTWQILQPNVHITLNNGDKMQLMAANRLNGIKPTVDSTYGIGNIKVTDTVYVSGNVMSLLDGSYNNAGYYNFETMQEIPHDNQFKGLFKDNTNLTLAYSDDLVLPATKLKQSCYEDMFRGCININIWPNAAAPELPATILADNCYKTMFGWTNIINAPKLPALSLAYGCYNGMFWGCWNLTTPPTLPATQLKDSCYAYMFADSAITTPPQLPATNLKDYCYQYMFEGCTSLTTAPDLPATELSPVCYASMFEGCTSLTTAPTLSATQLAWGCYRQMFKNCSSLNSIKCLALDLGYSDWATTKDWVDGVAASGTFTKAATMQNWTTGIDGIPSGWTIDVEDLPYFTIKSISDNNDISYKSNVNNTFEYSIDHGDNWVTWSPDTNVTLNNGDKMLVRGNNPTVDSTYGIGTFYATNYFNVSGNIMSLVDGDNYATSTSIVNRQFKRLFNENVYLVNASELLLPVTTLKQYCYESMFNGCTSLVTAPALSATTLAKYCYSNMFNGCTSLITAPTLPATTLAESCYYEMFYGCTSLTTASEIYATTFAYHSCYNMFRVCTSLSIVPALRINILASECCYSMFRGCTSLVNAPALPVTTLAYGCYSGMFSGCTSLTAAPELPATTLAEYCYAGMFSGCTLLTTTPTLPVTTLKDGCYNSMFSGCTSLTAAPELPATTLAYYCYSGMFSGCTSLVTAPALPATTLAEGCYSSMFERCTSLVTAPALPATTLAENCYNSMFRSCSSLVTSPVLSATTLAKRCCYEMFQRCTSLVTAPALPATTLAEGCYYDMFRECTSLIASPVLSAQTLVTECYQGMFIDCSSLTNIECLATNRSGARCTLFWVWNVSSTGTFVKDASMQNWPSGVDGIPSGWTVQDAS